MQEVGEEDEDDEDVLNSNTKNRNNNNNNKNDLLVAPMSVQPTRKAKTSTLSIAALRRL